MTKRIDGPMIAYGTMALAALVVSAPATYNLVALYHSDGTSAGIAATVALLLILEAGAVAAKLATLWAREGKAALLAFVWFALGVNTLSNLIHGGALATRNGLPGIAAWGGALIYAAFLPGLIYLMLHLICLRVERLRGVERTTAEEVAGILQPVSHAVEVARQAQQRLAQLQPLAALPEPQASYPRAEAVAAPAAAQPVLTLPSACPECGTGPTRMQARTAEQHQGWNCKHCGKRVSPR